MPEEKNGRPDVGRKTRNDGHNDGRKVIMQIENLSKTCYQGKIPVHDLCCACITVRKGELLAIMGTSGFF